MIGASQLLILAVIVVILILGPSKLPQLVAVWETPFVDSKGMSGEDEDEIDVTHSSKESSMRA